MGDGSTCIAQIVYLLAAKLISSSANQSLGLCPLLEARRALQEGDSSAGPGANKESKLQKSVCVLNNLSDLSEVLQEMPCGVRRTTVGSSQLSRMGVYPLSVFV